MTKRGCDVSTCEITRFYRINNNGFCQVIPFTVPRKSELFQEDLYPDTLADVPALTAEDWFSGTNADPILVPMGQQGVEIKKVCFQGTYFYDAKKTSQRFFSETLFSISKVAKCFYLIDFFECRR